MTKVNQMSLSKDYYMWEPFLEQNQVKFPDFQESSQSYSYQPKSVNEDDELPKPVNQMPLLSLDKVPNFTHFDAFMQQLLEQEELKKDDQTRDGFVEKTTSGFVNHSNKDAIVEKFDHEDLLDYKEEQPVRENKSYYDSIFVQKKIKGGFKKNTNVPKFLVRVFIKHFSTYAKHYNSELILKYHKKIKKQISSRISNNYTISDVLKLFSNSKDLKNEHKMINQQIMFSIIRDTLQDQVISSKYIKNNQRSYMLAMKLYALRCRSQTLTERVKIF